MKIFRVEYKFNSDTEWFTDDYLMHVIASNHEDAALKAAYTDGLENASFRVTELLFDDFTRRYEPLSFYHSKIFSF